MASFSRGDIVKVPFPYTDRSTRQWRPALVVSSPDLEDTHGLLWVLMITSAENRGWPGDVAIQRLRGTGLPVESVVRTAKIATIEAGDAVALGVLPAAIRRRVSRELERSLADARDS